jgi:hypothetical protein
MFAFVCCSRSKKKELKLKPPEYIEPRKSVVELVKYEKIAGELSDTSCEPVLSTTPTPPPRDKSKQISFLVCDKEDNSEKSSEDDSLFNISVNHSILSEKFAANSSFKSRNVMILSGKEDELTNQTEIGDKIEPLFTINISVKNERNGVLIHRKIYL